MESSRPADGECSGQQQERPVLAEPQQPPDPLPTRRALGRLHHRQPKRSNLLLRLQQQQNPAAETAAWQLSDTPGPSGGRFPSPSTSSTPPLPSSSFNRGQHTQGVSSQSSQEVPEGGGPSKRGEKKPQKPGKYVCTYCGRPCAKPSVLQKHIRSHTGERPYPCAPCGFSFKTKSNLYKHRKSHAHRIKAGLVSSRDEASLSGAEVGAQGEEPEEPTEGESTDSEEETGQHRAATSKERMGRQSSSSGAELPGPLGEEAHRSEDSQAVKQRLARRLCERKRGPNASPDDQPSTSSSLGPGSKGSTESGYFSCSGSTELSQVSPPSANVKSYAEIILGKYGRLGGQQRGPHQQYLHPSLSSPLGPEDKSIPFTVPKTQVIEHITKLITINEAVVDTSEIDSVKPRRSSLSRKSSLESLKFSSPKDPYVFEPKGEAPSPSTSGVPHAPSPDPAGVHESSSVPLLRSHSMPPSASQGDPSTGTATLRGYRLSQSFDEQQAVMAAMRVGHAQRMLKRQPAIEVPLGAELTLEEAGPSSSPLVLKGGGPAQEMPQRQQQQPCRGSFPYECEACGARCKKRKSFEAHRGLCPGQPVPHQERENVGGESRENRPQMMHYKFRALAMAVRKRRKEESLEEDPPSPGPAAVSCSPLEPTSVPSRLEHSAPSQIEPQQDRKGVSVIQHTSSFEKQESISMENQEPELRDSQPTQQQPEPKPSPSTSRLVRQHNIQVPEILVTVEPDADMPSASPPATASSSKELDRVEEFQWPPRSQSLAQLPAEKLPPKKKRLRLAEATHSSGESSFESVSLPRSPSQESNVSHTSSRSASFEDTVKPDPALRSSGSQGSHMLTVPLVSHQHQQLHKEMRRSVSEQAPASPQHTAPIPEPRSKSFDYGSLSPQQPTSAWKERRKCLLVKHATLGEAEPEEGATKSQLSRPGSPKPGPSHPFPQILYPAEATTSRLSPEAIGKTLQLFQHQVIHLPKAVLPLQPRAHEVFPPGPLAQLLPVTTAISEVLSNHMFRQAFLHTHTAPPPIQLHPAQLRAAERLGLPLHPFPGLLPLQLPTLAGSGQAVYFPVPPGLQVPSQPPPGIREARPGTSSTPTALICQSPAPLSHHHHRPVIATCLAQLTPVVSLVVPVRLQTHMPTYASAMYTTLSQILVSARSQEPVCCEAMVIMGQLEQDKLQRSYLKIPTPDFKSYLPLSLPVELGLELGSGEAYGPLGPGGSKRMLSPAASLELSTEAKRQQKRVKEEREEQGEEEEEKTGEAQENKDIGEKLEGGEKMEPKSVEAETVTVKVEAEEEEKQVLVEPSRAGEKEEEEVLGKTEPKPKEEEQEEQGPGVSGAPRPQSPLRPTAPPFPILHTTTSVSWCYLNYVKPNPSAQTEPQASVYSSWSVSVHNPNLPGLSTKVALSLLRSKQNHSSETYTMATGGTTATGKLVPASSTKPCVSEVHATPPSTPVKVKELPLPEKEEKKRGRREKEGPSTSKQSESPRVRIFEGGYKSNEEYVYVRGRGRGKYVCGDCGIRCKKPSMLRKHIRTHTDVRPYVCKHCNFAFKTKGNLTKHMKSKAHGKKCQSMGVSESSLDEPESEDAEGSEEQLFGSEDPEEHQFSAADDSEEDDDNEEEEEEEEDEEEESSSHDDPSSSCSSDTRHPQQGTLDPEQLGLSPSLQLSPRRALSSGHAASPGTRRALFAHMGSNASPRAFSPSGESCSPLCSLSPRTELSSPSQHISPSADRGPCPNKALSPLHLLSSIQTPSPSCVKEMRAQASFLPFGVRQRPSGYLPWEGPAAVHSNVMLERSGIPGLVSPEASLFSPTFHLSPSEGSGHLSPTSEDQVFSHLPMHSQQAKVPYLMIPIGGIQMVQAQLRCHPITTISLPCSPPLEVPSLALPKSGGPWGGNLTTRVLWTPGDHWLKKQETVTSQSGLCDSSTAPSCSIPETTDSKQYSSSYSSSHNNRPETRTTERCLSNRHTGPPLSQPASLTSYRIGQTVQRGAPLQLQPREGGSKREPDRIDEGTY